MSDALNAQQFGTEWIPTAGSAGSVMDRAQRSINGETMQNMIRKGMHQPTIGASEQDVERRAYGFFNAAGFPELPQIRQYGEGQQR